MAEDEVQLTRLPTVVRNILFLPPAPTAASYSLLSVDGRRVLSLGPGANDVRGLAPGVYFVRPAEGSSVAKVMLAR